MGPQPFKIDRTFLKSKVSEAEINKEKARQEAVGGQCTVTEEVTDGGEVWHLVCTYFGGAGASGG
jgi:hypothetical protein